jgi:hypothetical protein
MVPRGFSREPVPFISGEAVKMFGGTDTSNRKKLIIEEDAVVEKPAVYTFGERNVPQKTEEKKIEFIVPTRKGDEEKEKEKERERERLLREEDQRQKAVPKLKREGYYTVPPLSQLQQSTLTDLSKVNNFTVGLKDSCEIRFEGATNVRGLDLDNIVELHSKQIIVYPDPKELPPVGEGLNKPAMIVVKNLKPKSTNPNALSNYEKNLRTFVEQSEGTFIGYDPSRGELTFSVKNFVNR